MHRWCLTLGSESPGRVPAARDNTKGGGVKVDGGRVGTCDTATRRERSGATSTYTANAACWTAGCDHAALRSPWGVNCHAELHLSYRCLS